MAKQRSDISLINIEPVLTWRGEIKKKQWNFFDSLFLLIGSLSCLLNKKKKPSEKGTKKNGL